MIPITHFPRAFAALIVVSAIAVASVHARAAAPAGTVAYTAGVVSIEPASGAKRFAVAGSSVESGDTIETSTEGEAVLLMADHQRVYLKAETRYRIDDYRFAENDAKNNVSVSSLLKGGLRLISGLIGKQGVPDAYRLNTQTATIGIRGTEWSVLECGLASRLPSGEGAGPMSVPASEPQALALECPRGEAGEHIRVYHGTIDVRTEVDHHELSEGFGTIIRSPRSTIGLMPGANVEPVVPSPAACK
ncbi:FecR family protein [Trinickia symbiotica]|uniref:FecR protein domain-containing protein n=1 Tax=Trinickia symbiotica TaxID=863227 RepID=A0A2N7WS16_9BURK|nr:FecR family protein [Trinickia symbiotica]PMS32248.1 hypothetical protein C0Z20_26745 [Trinickia symbiotica]PPK45191.1 FecR family protein [Trinickia symbiotica]